MMEAIDAVITWVDGNDPEWQQSYAKATNRPILAKRYRDWGFLPYLFRGIEQYMPFINKVHLVVASESQVPNWINRNQVHIVLHEDIIPAAYLPTFNSTTIELFLHRIPTLSERFIYFNDDMFPVAPLSESTFFQEDKIVMGFSKHLLPWGLYKQQTRQSAKMACKLIGKRLGCLFIRPQHICTPMLRSVNEKVYNALQDDLGPHITMLRRKDNTNQYLYPDYLYYTHRAVCKPIPTKHCSMAVYSADGIAQHIMYPRKAMLCINDVEMSDARQAEMRTKLLQAFASRLPQQSRFEK